MRGAEWMGGMGRKGKGGAWDLRAGERSSHWRWESNSEAICQGVCGCWSANAGSSRIRCVLVRRLLCCRRRGPNPNQWFRFETEFPGEICFMRSKLD